MTAGPGPGLAASRPQPGNPMTSPDDASPALSSSRGALRPGHLYKFGGLLFLLALAYRFFDTLSRVFLLVYEIGRAHV